MNKPARLIVKADGATLQTLEPGRKVKIVAKASTRYRVSRAEQTEQAVKADEAAQAEALAAQVLASRHGDDLRLDYADGSQLQLEGFFLVCQGAQGSACAVELPAANGGTQLLGGESASGAASAGQGYALYAYGASSEMAGLLQAQGLHTEGLKGLSQDGDQISYLPPADGFNWAWLAPMAVLPALSGSGSGSAAAAPQVSTILNGSVVAGPVLAGNGLVVTAYKADGTVLTRGVVNADGSFMLTVGNDYQGPVLVKVSDTSDGSDYFDEASGAARDLGADLRALTVISGAGTYIVSVNALTELAVRHLGLEGGNDGASDNGFGGLSVAQIQAANQQVAAAVGLRQDLVLGAPAVAIVTVEGESNPQANDYGQLLAAISGAEVDSSIETVLDTLVQSLGAGTASGATLELLLDGAAKAQIAGLVDAVSDITSQKSAQVSIDPVAGNNRIGAAEMAAGVTVTGQAAANAIVTIEWSDVSSGGQPSGTRSVTADAQGIWSVTFAATEMPALGATSLKASVGTETATRSVYLDAPAAPTIKLHADSGSSASDGLTSDPLVEVSGFVDGWDYSTDGGQNWTAGQGSGFQVSGDGAQNVQVRQNVGGHHSESASLGFTLDTLAPTVAIGSDKTALKIGETATITFTLSESSSDFAADDIAVSGGALSGFTGSGTSYSATFTPTADSKATASIGVGSGRFSDAAGNQNADGSDANNAVAISFDTRVPLEPVAPQAPGLRLASDTGTSASDGLTADGEIQVSGLEDGASWAYSLDGGSSWIEGSGTTIAALALGADGAKTVKVRQTDAVGNVSASESISFTLDSTPPAKPNAALTSDSGSSASDGLTHSGAISAPGNAEAGAKVEYRVKKDGGAFSAWSETYTAPATDGSADGLYAVEVRQTDNAGNVSEVQSLGYTLDASAPTIAIGSDKTALKAGETAAITFTLSEASSDFTAADVSVSGGTLSNFTGSGASYSAIFTPTADSNAAASISVASGKFSDAAGNQNADGADSNNTVAIGIDTLRPTVAVGSDKTALKAGETATITFTLSEASSDFTAADVTSGGTLSQFRGSGASYSAIFTPTADSNAAASISVASGKFSDAAGNQNADGADSNNTVAIGIDTLRPTVAVGSDKTALKAGETATVTFTLSEASSDFTAADVTVSGGTLSQFRGSGASYSAIFTPTADSNAAASISVASGKFSDAAGNQNADGADSNNTVAIGIDTLRPTVAVGSDKTALKAGETATVTFTLSEASSDFTAADVTVSGGTLSGFAGSGASYSAIFTPDADSNSSASISVASSQFSNAAGNQNADGSDSNNAAAISIDTVRPTIEVSSDKTALKVGETATVTFTLSEASSDFTAADVTVSGGALSNFTGSGASYSAIFTPTADSNAAASISVASDKFSNAAGNQNADGTDSNNAASISIDTLLAQVIQGTPLSTPIGTDGSWATTRYSIGDLSSLFTIFSDPQALLAIQATVVVHRPDGTALEPIQLTGIPPIDFWSFYLSFYQSGDFSLADLFPSPVTALADGGFLLTSLNVSNESWEVQRFDASGQPAGDVIELPGVSSMLSPKVVAVGSGFVITYGAPDVGGDGSHLEMLWLGDAGASKIVVVPDSSDAAGISLVALGGGVGLAWTGMGNSWDKKNHFATFDANHDLSSSYETVVTSSTQGFAGVPTMTSLSDGTPLLVWRDETTLSSKTVLALGSAPGDTYTLDNVEPGSEKFLALEGQGDHPPFLLSAIRTVDGKRELFLSRIESLDAPFDTKTELWSYQVPQNSAANWCLSSIGQEGDFLFAYQDEGALTVLRFDSQGKPVGEPNVVLFGLPFWINSLTATDDGYVMTGLSLEHADGVVLHFDAKGQLLTGPDELFAVDSDIGLFGSEAATYYLVHNSVSVTDLSDITGAGDGLWNQQQAKKGVFALSTEGLIDGEYRLYALDEAGNFGPASSRSVRVDANAPGVQLTFDQDSLKIGETAQLTVQFSEAVTGFDASHLVVTGGKISDLVQDGSDPLRYSATFTPDANYEGQAKVELVAGLVSDLVGHVNARSQVELAVDTLRPTIAVSSDKAALKAGETATVTFTLSESSSDFTEADVMVSGGTLSGFTGSGASYSATFTPDVDSNTPASIGIASDKFSDAAGNQNVDGDDDNNAVAISIDTVRPTIEVSSDKTALKAGETATITFTLSEASSDFAAADVTVSGGALSGFTGSGASYSATFTPDVNSETPASIGVASEKFSDAAGNQNADGADTDNKVAISVDTLLPTIAISSDKAALKAGETATITFTLSEASTDFTADDVVVSGGTLSGFTGSGTSYSATFTPDADSNTAASIGVASDKFADAAGNQNADGDDANNAVAISVDTQAPSAPGIGLAVDTGSSDADGLSSNGQLKVSGLEAGASWEYSLDGGDNWIDGSGTMIEASALGADGAKTVEVRQIDAAGNVSTSQTIGFTLDSTKPAVPILALERDSGNGVDDAYATDKISSSATLQVTGAESGAVVEYSANGTDGWSIVAPQATEGSNTVYVRQTDAAGNVSDNGSFSFTLDTTKPAAPTLALDSDTGSSDTDKISSSATLKVTGTETGALVEYSANGTDGWSTSAPSASEGLDTVYVRQTDKAGNVSASQSLSLTLDTVAPTLGKISPADGSLAGPSSELTLGFDGPVVAVAGKKIRLVDDTAQTTTEIDVTNTDLVKVDANGKVTLNPGADLTMAHDYHVEIDAGAFTDLAGNEYAGLADSTSWNFSVPDPAISLDAVAVDNVVNAAENASPVTISGKLSSTGGADVLNSFVLADFSVKLTPKTGSEVTATVTSYDPQTGVWTATVPSLTLVDGSYDISVKAINGSSLSASSSASLEVDLTAPTIAIGSDMTALKAGETATVTFTLSEASSDFTADDVVVSGGTLSGFTGSGASYSATFTPDVDSNTPASIGIASDKFSDAAGNQNADGDDDNNAVAISIDTLRPTIAVGSDKTTLHAGETVTITFTLSEASSDFTAADVTVSGGTLSGFTGSGKDYSVTFTSTTDSATAASIGVASAKFSDAAGNQNADGADTDNTVAISIDTLAPVAPGLSLAADTGSSDSDGLTSNGQLNVTGLEDGARWQYSLDGGTNWTDGSGTTIAASVLGADGAKTVEVRQSDAAGNVSEVQSLDLTLDTSKPATPTAKLTTDSSNGGDGFDADGITKSGAISAPNNTETGAQVEYRVKRGDGQFSAWSEIYTAPATDGSADGAYSVEVRQTDKAGNASDSQTISFTLDSTPPAKPNAALTFDSGSSDSDDISNSGALTAPTNNEAGAKVEYRVKGPGAMDFGSWSETYTAPATDGSVDGIYQVEVRQTDKAGNVSTSQSLAYTLDTIKPTAVIALGDTALKIGDQSQVTITFSEAVSGLGQESFEVLGGTLSDPVSNDGGITWIATLTPAANLEDASNLITLKAGTVQDLAGNVIAGATASANYAIDTIAPPAAVLALHSDTGAPDGLTSDGRVDITGLVAGAYWDYSADGGVSWTPGSGNSITLEDDGTYVVVVRQFDAAGNFSLSQPLTFNLLGLVASPRLGLALHQDTGGSEGVTADGTVDISGLAAGAVWQYSLDGGSTWHAGSETSIPASALGGDGDKSVIVRQVNLFGTVSDNSDPLLFRLDTQAPAAPSLALNLDSGANAGDGLTHDARIDVGGLETGTGWEYSLDNGVSWLAGSGNAIAASALGGDGDKAILVRQTDQAGNVGKEARLSFTLDTSAPTLTGTGPEVDGFQAPGDNLVLHFSEAVVAGSGAIRLVNDDDHSTVTLAVGGAEIGINGTTVTIDPASDLLLGKHYHVEIDSTAFTDAAGNAYAGIGDGTSWRFLVPDPAVGLDAIAGDGAINAAEKTATLNLGGKLSSTGGASVVGAFVAGDFTVTLTPSGGSPVVATVTAYDSSTGAWSASIATAGLADDQYTVSVVASHNGLVAEHRSSLLIDTEVATPTLSLAADTGTASGDGITHDALVKVAGLEANASWEYSTDGGSNWQAGVGASFKLAADGSHDLRVRQTDAAGNRSESSAALTVVLDTVAPATPDAMLTASLSDGGAIVAPTHLEAGAMLEYRLKKNGVNVTGSNDGWSESYAAPAGSPANAGNYLLEIRQVDVAGNVSASQKLEFMVAGGGLGAAAIAAGEGGFVIDGQTAGAYAGLSVSGAGDVNGDGLADLVVGAPVQHCAYVVFGKTQGGPVDLNAVAAGQGGYMIYPPFLANGNVSLEDLQSLESGSGLLNGFSVSGAGDVNGDGLADVIVGAPLLLGGGYVVYGKSTGTPVNLSSVLTGADGMAMISTVPFDLAGISVSAAGDVNGDGLADLIVGAPAPLGGVGMAYVVFGGAGKSTLNLSSLGSGQGGFVIEGLGASEMSGWSVSGAGDVNGDGLADLVVGAPYLTSGVGQAYVVYGKTGGDIIKLSAIEAGSGGYAIKGLVQGDAAGTSVSGVGDVNGDGLADLIVGSPLIGNEAGASYVVFGRSDGAAVELSAVAAGTGGFVINSQGASCQTGVGVSGAGDVNGDGLADLIIGAPGVKGSTGRSYVVFGHTGTQAVDLGTVALGAGGFAIDGEVAGDMSGFGVSSAGDVNGDGLADLIVGAPYWNDKTGRAYVIFGATDGAFAQTAVDQLGTSDTDVMSDDGIARTLVAGAGDDSLSATAASVLQGGAGNDTFNIGSAMITALQSPLGSGGNDGQLARIDGGSGLDTIALSGAGLTLDLTQVANQAAGNPDGGSRLSSIERIDLGGLSNQLKLTASDIHDLAGMNSFNGLNGWNGLADAVARHQLLVEGGVGDTLSASGSWAELAGVTHGGQTYRRLVQGKAELLVDADITLDLTIAPGVTGIAFGSAPVTQGGFLKKDDWISFEVTFSEAMFFGGGLVPQLALDIGGTTVQASYDSGSGTDKWVFKYPVAAGLTDLDGISIGADAVSRPAGFPSMPSGTVRNASGVDAVFINDPVPANASWRVDSVVPVAPDATLTAAEDDGGAIVAPTNLEAGATLEYRLKKDGVNVTASNDGWGSSYQPPATDGSANGTYTLELRQTDAAGNASASQKLEFTLGPKYAPVELSDIAAGSGGFVINGQCAYDLSGYSVSGAGDVNGDGLADLIVGAPYADPTNSDYSGGRSYVVFGRSTGAAIELSAVALCSGGFVINGQGASDWSGWSVSGAGDVNGDGLADLIVGAPSGDPAARSDAGRSYVVFGRSAGAAIDLSAVALGSGGFVINGQGAYDNSGYTVSSAGDVNGDGLADLIVGAYYSTPAAGSLAGRSYVVFGRSTGQAIDLSAVAGGTGGFVINGQCAYDLSGVSVSGAGDVDGDGLADLIVGAYYSTPEAGSLAGRSYVVFGRSAGTAIDLSAVALGSGGFVINGQCAVDFSGYSVSSAGDVNGDGLADLIVGAYYSTPAAGDGAGRSYVVFGRSTGQAIELSAVAAGSGGFVINGSASGDNSGWSVSSAGDVNGDGLADLIVGACYSDPAAGDDAGRSYVVFGRTGGAAIDLSAVALGSGGFVINGQGANDYSGVSVSGAGDVNGDGLADLIVGASGADPSADRDSAGRSYVIFGATDGAFSRTAVDWLGTSGDDSQSDGGVAKTLVAGAGDDSLTAMAASMLHGGAGNDTFNIGSAMITALQSPLGSGGNDGQLVRLDGGSGVDSLVLTGTNLTLDLTKIANQAGGDPETGSRLASIERIDLSGSGNNQLTLSVADVRDLGGMNLYNSGNGWTGLAASVGKHQLRVDGDAGDLVVGSGYWAPRGTAGFDGRSYTVYDSFDGSAQLLVNQSVTTRLPFPTVELSAIADGAGGFVINGQGASDYSGYSVSSAGDVNGDGLADLIIGARTSDPTNRTDAGRSYVVFGRTEQAVVELSALGTGGFVINGQCANDWSGASVSGAGDVNGDGLADLIVGASGGDPGNRTDAGRSYVVFGRTATTTIELSALGASGFVINGQGASDQSGFSVSSAGDVNGDGLADLIVGARASDPTNRSDGGRSYVVFGRTGQTAVELSAVAAGTGGFVINGQGASDLSGSSVSCAGDVNGDGLADLIVGAPYGDPAAERSDAGRSYVIFGRTGQTAVELSALGAGGFVINGQCANDQSGMTVSGAGDVNGDGLADLIIGSSAADSDAGRSYVVFGRTGQTAVELSAVAAGSGGFVIRGQCAGDGSGASISCAGDVNGDGLADLIVGAYGANGGAGHSYVVFGRSTGMAIDLSTVGAGQGGFVINGQCAGDLSGFSVSSAGDVNGDGLADLIVGAGWSDPAAGDSAGRSYVIFGSTGGAFSSSTVDWFGTAGADSQSDGGVARTLVAGAGDDSLTATAASVLYGGAGNDSFNINSAMISALQSPLGSGGNVGQLARIDGGAGVDKIVLQGESLHFDLTQITQSAMNPEGVSRLSGIEEIDIIGSGANTIKLTAKDVFDMGGKTNVKDFGWGTVRRELIITGDAGDTVDLADAAGIGGWTADTGVLWAGYNYNGKAYYAYNFTASSNSAAPVVLLVQKDMTVI